MSFTKSQVTASNFARSTICIQKMTAMKLLSQVTVGSLGINLCRVFGTDVRAYGRPRHYKLVVVGGGSGGASTAAKFTHALGKGNVAVVEPGQYHYYQPMWTLVGAGLKTLENSSRRMESVLPKDSEWIKDEAVAFDPDRCSLETTGGYQISYDYLIIAMGMQLNCKEIKGLPEALENDPAVCSNYLSHTVTKTFPALQQLEEGNAIFTFPNTPVKCAGAPQKIMYLAEDYLSKNGKRDEINIIYNTSLGVIFGVKKYANSLASIVKERNIQVNYRKNLTEVCHQKREATFIDLDSDDGRTETYQYSFLHVAPPMSAPDCLRSSSLVNEDGFLNVNKETLQHVNYPNIFGIGDCTSVPTSKTAAAAAAQSGILYKNLTTVMNGGTPQKEYDGYTSCPLITSYGKCILAEFDFNGQPLETFPVDQSKERRTMYHMKKDVMPHIYWQLMTRGYWNGPAFSRKLLHLGMSK